MSSALAIKAASPGVAIVKPDASSRLGPNKCRACAFVGLTLKEWVLAASGFGAAFFNRRPEMFAQESRPGWDTWGDQSALFDAGSVETRNRPSHMGRDGAHQYALGLE